MVYRMTTSSDVVSFVIGTGVMIDLVIRVSLIIFSCPNLRGWHARIRGGICNGRWTEWYKAIFLETMCNCMTSLV